jgi:hypothetical protein
MYAYRDLQWVGTTLRLRRTRRLLATIVPDADNPFLWRVRLPRAGLSDDAVNLARAREAAVSLALANLNRDVARAA